MSKQRQLVAIMFTDIVGYTALMQRDEIKAVAIRERHRLAFESVTRKHKGKILQYFGDGTLSIFKSTVEAVECAIELQREWLQDPMIPVRIGIHVGDIMFSDDDIVGDAVNVASRIESCGVEGSIIISDKVHDQLRSHRHIESKFLGAYEFTNVDGAMPIFAIANSDLVIPERDEVKARLKGKVAKEPFKISVKKIAIGFLLLLLAIFLSYKFGLFSFNDTNHEKSIAVLPFDILSTDEDAEIFRDGIIEDILTQLSKIEDLHVISRTSVMKYKNTTKTITEIAKELGVTYILEGSIRKYDKNVRVTAKLINTKDDENIMSEQFDRTLSDILSLQTDVSIDIVDALELNLTFEQQQRLDQTATQNIDAFKLFIKGRKEADKRNRESIAKSIELYQRALLADPNFAEAYAEIANSIYLETYYAGRDPVEATKLANDYLDKALAINDEVSRIYSVRGLIYNIEGKYDMAKTAFEKAIKLAPNDVTAHQQFATFYYYNQQYDEQLHHAEIAYKLDPLSFAIANSYFTALMANEMYGEAEQLMMKVERQDDNNNQFVINRSYFRLYITQKKYDKAIIPLREIVLKEPVYNRFLAYCYAKVGDTIRTLETIQKIRNFDEPDERNYMLAMSYAGLQRSDSSLYYLKTISTKDVINTFARERQDFFEYLREDSEFLNIEKQLGLD